MENLVKKTIDCSKKITINAFLRIKNLKDDVKGMSTIEVVLIVAVLVALALLFRVFIMKYADSLFTKINDKTADALEDW